MIATPLETPFAVADVVVAGGGLTGAAAAWSLARDGARVVVVEPTGVLGREVTRQRSLFVDITSPGFSPGFAEEPFAAAFAAELEDGGAVFPPRGDRPAGIDPHAVGLALDALLARAGVEVLFQCLPTQILGDPAAPGLAIATRNGATRVHAPLVIDASRTRRLAVAVAEPAEVLPPRSGIRLMVAAVTEPVPAMATLDDPSTPVALTALPTFWEGELRVEAVVEADVPDVDIAPLVHRVVSALPDVLPQVRDAVVTVVAEEAVRAGGVRYAAGSPRPGVVLAGEWTGDNDPFAGDTDRVLALIAAGAAAVRALTPAR